MPVESNQAILQPIMPYGFQTDPILGSHIGNTDYLLAPGHFIDLQLPVSIINSNEEAWLSIMTGGVSEGMKVILNQFQIFDWFPRAPGLFYTNEARWARDEAFHYIDPNFSHAPINDQSQAKNDNKHAQNYTTVFSPEGKLSMLQGGIGAIRLKPLTIENEPYWLMTASSDGITHTGVPLAIPRRIYTPLLSYIQNYGAVCATVSGTIEFVPNPFSRLFDRSISVPKILLKVEEISNPSIPAKPLKNSVAVNFLSDYEGPVKLYSTYVTFRPDVKGSFEKAISWMQKEYVEGAYHGKIITDFDQVKTVFPEANLSLTKVMGRLVSRGELQEMVELMNASANVDDYFDLISQQNLLPNKEKSERRKIFISYSHAAEERTNWVTRILAHLKGLAHSEDIEIWSDNKIEPGQKWQQEIEKAIKQTKVAVIVLTADFLSSEFIINAELPPLLEAADAEGATILCIYGSDVHLSGIAERLTRYQFVNKPERPLLGLSENERETVYKNLNIAVQKIIKGKISDN